MVTVDNCENCFQSSWFVVGILWAVQRPQRIQELITKSPFVQVLADQLLDPSRTLDGPQHDHDEPTALEAVPAVVDGHHHGVVASRLDAVDDWFCVGGHRSVAGQVGVLDVVSDA